MARQGADLLLVDMNLPDMTGLQLLAALRADTTLPQPPCIALSADGMSAQIEAARAAGFADYWLKPINVQELLSALQRLFERPTA